MNVRACLWLLPFVASACRDDATAIDPGGSTGASSDSGASSSGESGDPAPPTDVDGVGPMGARRLTIYEYDNTLRDVLGDDTRPGASFLPEDRRTPFDNEYAVQVASRVLVEGAETLARDVASRAVAERRDAIVGCTPDEPTCMRSFVETMGRRMLRRPLDADEIDDFTALATEQEGFDDGIEVVLRAFLQDPEFLYRIELGRPVEGRPELFRLSGYEIATRMAYLIWGSAPDDALLDRARDGELEESDGRIEAATMMLADPRARTQIDRFHAQWLGYDQLPHPPELTHAMRTETQRLVERVIFDEQDDWVRLFTSPETYLPDGLGEHYGIEGSGWVDVSAHGRQGVLSTGAFLSVASNVDDTSPTKRGKLVRERLMCQTIPPPPPEAMADVPPTALGGECRLDQYLAHREQGTCAGCHALMDDIGFGLERYDQLGKFREYEYFSEGVALNDACPLDGVGTIDTLGGFRDPAGLAQLLVEEEIVQACVVEQLYTYAMGHAPDDADEPFVEALTTAFTDSGHRFDALVIDVIGSEAFAYRTEEVE